MAGPLRLLRTEKTFGIEAAARVLLEACAPWVQDLGLLVEKIESSAPHDTADDWQPGAVLRLPYSRKICGRDGTLSSQALLAAADTAMVIACSVAWDGYSPMTPVDHTMHFLRPASFDVLADARILRISRTTTFGRVTLIGASDRRPVGMVSGAYSTI